MKRKLQILLFLIPVLALVSCDDSLENGLTPVVQQENKTEENRTPNENSILAYIRSKPARTRSSEDPLLVPYIVEGDTVMYVVNYDEGWELFSNDRKAPMVLMKSETGSFFPTEATMQVPFADIFENSVDALSELKKDPTLVEGEDPSWIPEVAADTLTKPTKRYVWTCVWRVAREENFDLTPLGGRLRTKWDQGYPYNLFTPYYVNEYGTRVHCYAGCGPVSMGQYLYWHYTHFGTPANIVETAEYDVANNKYVFSGSSPALWNDMLNLDTEEFYSQYYATSIFLGYLGHLAQTDYKQDGSGSRTGDGNMKITLKSLLDCKYTQSLANHDLIVKILSKNYPAIAVCEGTFTPDSNKVSKGADHAFIIDYYNTCVTTYIEFWAYRDESGLIENPAFYFDENTTLDDVKRVYGDFAEEKETGKSYSYYFKANWGWGGYCDDVSINTKAAYWEFRTNSGKYSYTDNYLLYKSDL